MSASLVGSEMCIRDSPRTPPRSASGALAGLFFVVTIGFSAQNGTEYPGRGLVGWNLKLLRPP
eukprot:9190241-Alexandrium_andersonii.AAC.1